MFAYLNGIVAAKSPTHVVIDINGLGYIALIPHQANEKLPAIGETAKIYTTFVVREFAHSLYGFLSEYERDIFEVLMNITGVGPKLALSLIGYLPIDILQQAVMMQDVRALCNVPGVGKKTAERLIVELKDKMANLVHIDRQEFVATPTSDPRHQLTQDAILALVNLGYTQAVAYKAVKQSLKELDNVADIAHLVTVSLRNT